MGSQDVLVVACCLSMTENKKKKHCRRHLMFFFCVQPFGVELRGGQRIHFIPVRNRSLRVMHCLSCGGISSCVFFVPKQAKKLTKKMMVFDGWRLYHHQQSSPGKKTVGQFSPLSTMSNTFLSNFIFFLTFSFKSLKGNKFPTFGFLIFPRQYKHFSPLLNLDQITAPNPLRN